MTSQKLRYKRDGETVLDHTTGLMWQQSGSLNELTYAEAEEYVSNLNARKFAGYSDWRLPTLDEAKTILLLQPIDDFYCDQIFARKQSSIWTADKKSAGRAWFIGLYVGYYFISRSGFNHFVRAVRSGQSSL